MSNRAPAWFETKYADGVTHVLQSKGFLLKGTTRPPDRQNGNIINWRVAGSGEASQRSAANENPSLMNLDRTLVTATLTDWEANDFIDLYDLTKMSENENAVVQQSGAMAIGRRSDRIILDALNAATLPIVGTGAAAISILDIMEAQGQIADIGVGNYEYYCALPQRLMQQLELFREFSSSDYVGDDYPLLKQVSARRFRGITFIPIPSAWLNVPAANQIDGFLWVKDAVGFASLLEPRSRIDWIAEKKKWFVANDFSAIAAVILTNAAVRLRFATNIALTRPTP